MLAYIWSYFNINNKFKYYTFAPISIVAVITYGA